MSELADRFRALHVPGDPLLIPNPWDVGSARVLVSLGFRALATTSSGFAATLGRLDGTVTRDEAVTHGGQIAAAVEVPVSADLENGFADDPADVAATVRAAVDAGLAGCSVEDWSGSAIYDAALAAERIAAAVEAAAGQIVITARAENYLHERVDLADTIARLQSFAAAGADVVYAPGVVDSSELRTLIGEVGRPVNVLALPSAPPVAELAAARRRAHLGRRRVRVRRVRRARRGRPRTARGRHLRVLGAGRCRPQDRRNGLRRVATPLIRSAGVAQAWSGRRTVTVSVEQFRRHPEPAPVQLLADHRRVRLRHPSEPLVADADRRHRRGRVDRQPHVERPNAVRIGSEVGVEALDHARHLDHDLDVDRALVVAQVQRRDVVGQLEPRRLRGLQRRPERLGAGLALAHRAAGRLAHASS